MNEDEEKKGERAIVLEKKKERDKEKPRPISLSISDLDPFSLFKCQLENRIRRPPSACYNQ